MSAREVLRAFTPLHWILTAVAAALAIGALLMVLGGLGFRWDPFNSAERGIARADRRADQAETAAAAARSDSAARSAEAAGAQETTRQVERAGQDRAAVDRIVNRYASQIEATHETTPVPDDGADLRSLYDELCDGRPSVCDASAQPAPARNAGDGARGLPGSAAAG